MGMNIKVRIKFSKYGLMKFIGHLDVMRYFQKLLRRSDIPIAYSTGMSPHQIMSFAMPLGIGLESDAEYVDIEITERIASLTALKQMNEQNVEGIRILSFRELPEGAVNAMASIKAADYEVSFREEMKPDFSCFEMLEDMYEEPQISVFKKTKKSEMYVDIKPGIYGIWGNDGRIGMCLSCGSTLNIKPELVIQAVYDRLKKDFPEHALLIKRKEIYTESEGVRISLDKIGDDIL